MRVLVIGGSGFIGQPLVRQLLHAGHELAVVQRPESATPVPAGAHTIRADRRRFGEAAGELRAFGADVVIDLILSSARQASALVEVFRGHARRLVAITSVDVYRAVGVLHGLEDGPLEPLPLREDSALRTRLQTYPAATIEMLQRVFGWLDAEYDKIPVERAVMGDATLPATVLRLPMIYGPGDRLHRFWPVLTRMLDRRPALAMAESVAQWRSPRGYVENIADAIAAAATNGAAAGRIYNVAEPESATELEWARHIARAAGWTGEIVVVPDDDAPPALRPPGNLHQHWVVDSTRIRAELGYRERVPRDDAIRRTVEWEREHPPDVELTPIDYAAEDAALTKARARP